MLSRLSNPLVSLYFWANKPKPTHYLDMGKLVSDVLQENFPSEHNNIAYIERTFQEATDNVIDDKLRKKYYINRHAAACYSSNSWDDFFIDQKGLVVNLEGRSEWSLLAVAAFNNDLNLAKWLIENQGATINLEWCRSPLMVAASQGHIDFMKYLLKKGFDINYQARVDGGNTALHEAVRYGQIDVVDFLIQHDALLLEDKNHVTAIDIAQRILEINENKAISNDKHIPLQIPLYNALGQLVELPSTEKTFKMMEMLKKAFEYEATNSPRFGR